MLVVNRSERMHVIFRRRYRLQILTLALACLCDVAATADGHDGHDAGDVDDADRAVLYTRWWGACQ